MPHLREVEPSVLVQRNIQDGGLAPPVHIVSIGNPIPCTLEDNSFISLDSSDSA